MNRKTRKALSVLLAGCMAMTPASGVLAEDSNHLEQETAVAADSQNDAETVKESTSKESTDNAEPGTSAENADKTETVTSEENTDESETSSSQAGTDESETVTSEENTDESETGTSQAGTDESETGTSEENTDESETGASQENTDESETGASEANTDESETGASEENAQESSELKAASEESTEKESDQEEDANQTYPDGDYGIAIESGYKMFKIASSTAVVKDGKILVTMETASTSYDRIYLGSKDDEDKTPVIMGTLNAGETGYIFTFELDKSLMGREIDFVPGKSDGTWYTKNQYTLTIPAVLDYADGDYEIAIESGYKMFKIASSTAVVKDGKVLVTMETASTSYDRIYLGSKDDEDKTPVIMGTLNAGETGYIFNFELDKNMMGKTINFVPGKPDGTWYTKNQYTLTIPLAMNRVESGEEDSTEDETEQETETLDNGNYTVDVESSAAMFKVIDCVLKVKDGVYTADITLSGTGYDYLYMGTAKEAASADPSSYIGYTVNAKGEYVYTIPVSALDTQISVASHSIKNDTWYDRGLTFKSETAEKVTVLLQSGEYTVDVTTSTGIMFNVIDAVLTNNNGVMTAKITLSGTGYDYLYIGTAEAAQKDKAGWIAHTTNANGQYVFEIPVKALDTEILLVAHSVKNDTWYERGIIFESSTMKRTDGAETPETTPETETPAAVDKNPEKESKYETDLSGGTSRVDNSTGLADGVYTPDSFSWSGGSGRTSITCTKVTVSGGQAYATIVFGSSNYGYVKANGNKYFPTYGAGTSSFTIPVKLNANNTIIGMTTAMSAAHEVTYTIYIYIAGADSKSAGSDTTVDKNKLSEEAPEIIGLECQDEADIESAELFRIYYYDQGITMIEVDMASGTDKPETEAAEEENLTEETSEELPEETAELTSAEEELPEETAEMASAEESEETEEVVDTTTIISELYQNNVVRYLVVPEDAEVPVGLEKEMILIHVPVESVYTDSKQAMEILENLELKDLVTVQNAEEAMKPEYKELILNKCDIAILSDAFLWDESRTDLTLDEQSELLYEVAERLTTLGIPAIVDRSADESSEEAAAEWIKVYGEIFGCEELADKLYEGSIQ